MTEELLSVVSVSKRFGALSAVDSVSLDVRPGEIHALIGPNGAGKSTLIGIIAGWIAPDVGQVFLRGRDVTGESVAARARLGLGRTFQVSALAAGWSARRNVMLAVQAMQGSSYRYWGPVRSHCGLRDAADGILARFGLGARADLPVSALSHGERRLVEIACALALRPRVLLLDEPMAGLGPDGTADMTGFLRDLARGDVDPPGILLVEHDMDVVFSLSDRISVLVAGRVIVSGSAETVRSSADVRAAYLGEEDP